MRADVEESAELDLEVIRKRCEVENGERGGATWMQARDDRAALLNRVDDLMWKLAAAETEVARLRAQLSAPPSEPERFDPLGPPKPRRSPPCQ